MTNPAEARAYRKLELLAGKVGDSGTSCKASELGKELGFTVPESHRANVWLSQQGYVVTGFGHNSSITDSGRDKVEMIRMERFKTNAVGCWTASRLAETINLATRILRI